MGVLSVTWHVVGGSGVRVVYQHVVHVLVVSTYSVPQSQLLYSLAVLQSTLYNTNHQVSININDNMIACLPFPLWFLALRY